MLIDEMFEAFQGGTLGLGQSREWLELHRWQIGNAIEDLERTHATWTDLDANRMDKLIRIQEYFTVLLNFTQNEPISSASNKESFGRRILSFSGFGTTTAIQYPDFGQTGYSGLD